MKKAATTFRHVNICVIIVSQYIKAFQPAIRNNCDLVATFACMGEGDEDFVKSYFKGGSTRKKKDLLNSVLAEKYCCCVCNLVPRSLKFGDNIHRYIAKETREFKIGNKKEFKQTSFIEPINPFVLF